MLHYGVVFLVVALLAAVMGFSGVAGGSTGTAKVIAMVFIVLSAISLLFGWLRGR